MAKAELTSKGQITVPREVRERLGLRPGNEIEFASDTLGVYLRKCVVDSPFRKYRGDLQELAGLDPDELVEELRGR